MITTTKKNLAALDLRVLLALQTWRSRPLNAFFLGLTFSGTSYAWLSFATILNVLNFAQVEFIPAQHTFVRGLFCPLLAWIVSYGLKRLFSRLRPSDQIEGFQFLTVPPKCGSFPSSHAATTVSFAVGLACLGHPWALAVGVWAALVSFSRLYLGVHYLTDVLGGALIGAACGVLVVVSG